jgi:three-Cys-motif partner protein
VQTLRVAQAKLKLASDGHRARIAPTWTEEKLRILDCYLRGFAIACKRVGGWYALDLFAGGGLNISEATGSEIAGSPLIALEARSPEATLMLCCEQGEEVLAALHYRTERYGRRCEIFPGNANNEIAAMLARVPSRAPAFAFLDPEGAELEWETVRRVAEHKDPRSSKVEQLILFPTDMGFVRLLSLRKPLDPGYAERVTSMFGSDDWRGIYDRRRQDLIDAEQAREEYLRLYARGLRQLGYRHVQERQITKESTRSGGRGSPMYFLVHATDNDAGNTIMSHCFDKKHLRPEEERGQAAMFHTPVAPRRRRLLD